jgi:methionyl-tRNA synthetase
MAAHDHFYVTTPIYYVNGEPHIGTAYTTVLADVLARYHRLQGIPTHFLTGTDEHGQKVYEAAQSAGITPQEHTDRMVVRFREAWQGMAISNDDFIRTTEPRHTEVVTEILQDLFDRDEIYCGEYEGWYDVSNERFYTEKELVDGKSPDGKPVEKIREKNYFFRMSRYQTWLVDYIESNPGFIRPEYRRNETLGFLRKPLGDLCISRPKSRLPWGIELPFDRDFVCYVWFDALVNYVSAVGYRRDDATFEKWWPCSLHLIGKDILTTHTVYWPTMLKAMGVEMPRSFFAHGWWLTGGEKMSKSAGNVSNPLTMIDRYGLDALRYYLMAEMTLGQDATFTEESFVLRYNADLANDLGNLTSRALKMIGRSFEGRIPSPGPEGEEESTLREAVQRAVSAMPGHVEGLSLDRGIHEVIDAVRAANRYFDATAPWKLVRTGEVERLGTVIYSTAETLRIVSGLLYPVMPDKMTELRRMLGLTDDELAPKLDRLERWGGLEVGRPVGEITTLFPRIDRTALGDRAPAAPDAKKAAADPAKPEGVALIDVDTFFRAQLRVARVLAAEPVPKADRLLRLTISLGEETRQIVAGIAQFYTAAEMVGKSVVVVANLKPAKIRGVESNGMLLAAKDGKTLRVITVDGEIPAGSSVG